MDKDDHPAYLLTGIRINGAVPPTPDMSRTSSCLTQEEIYSYIRR